jgi:cell division protein FtsN
MKDLNLKLDAFLAEAISKFDCVILPEFGAFVSRYVSAEINRSNNIILPPSKTISFNVHLKHNDGLLAGYLSKKIDLSYDEALQLILNYSQQLNETVQFSKRAEIKDLGVLFVNNAQQLQFEPSHHRLQGQYNFGFAPIILQALKAKPYIDISAKTNPIERTDKIVAESHTNIMTQKPVNLNRLKRNYLALGVLIPVVAALCYISVKTVEHPNLNLASIFDRFKSTTTSQQTTPSNNNTQYNPAESKIDLMAYAEMNTEESALNEKYMSLLTPEKTFYIKPSANKTIQPKLESMNTNPSTISITNKENISATKSEKMIVVAPEKKHATNTTIETKLGDFCLVVGCFSENENAKKLVRRLKSESINALLDGVNDKGMTVVSAGKFATKEEALAQLNRLKSHNIKAWIRH